MDMPHLGEIWMTIKSMRPASYFQIRGIRLFANGGMEKTVIDIWIPRISPDDTPLMQCSYVVRREKVIKIKVQ